MHKISHFFENLSTKVSRWTGSSLGFAFALGLVICWFLLGPLFHYSETWQSFISISTAVLTFLMVFLIQRAQNKDVQALHIKLSELIASQKGASNKLLNVEERTEEELRELKELHSLLPHDTTESISLHDVAASPILLPNQIDTFE